MADIKKFAEELVNLTVKDVQELAKVLKEEYGIEPAAAAAGVAAPAAEVRLLLLSRLSSTLSLNQLVQLSSE